MFFRQKENQPNWQYSNVEMWVENMELLLFHNRMSCMYQVDGDLKSLTKTTQKQSI